MFSTVFRGSGTSSHFDEDPDPDNGTCGNKSKSKKEDDDDDDDDDDDNNDEKGSDNPDKKNEKETSMEPQAQDTTTGTTTTTTQQQTSPCPGAHSIRGPRAHLGQVALSKEEKDDEVDIERQHQPHAEEPLMKAVLVHVHDGQTVVWEEDNHHKHKETDAPNEKVYPKYMLWDGLRLVVNSRGYVC